MAYGANFWRSADKGLPPHTSTTTTTAATVNRRNIPKPGDCLNCEACKKFAVCSKRLCSDCKDRQEHAVLDLRGEIVTKSAPLTRVLAQKIVARLRSKGYSDILAAQSGYTIEIFRVFVKDLIRADVVEQRRVLQSKREITSITSVTLDDIASFCNFQSLDDSRGLGCTWLLSDCTIWMLAPPVKVEQSTNPVTNACNITVRASRVSLDRLGNWHFAKQYTAESVCAIKQHMRLAVQAHVAYGTELTPQQVAAANEQ